MRCCGVGLLLWKNLTLRKRHWLITLCEVLIPTFVYFFAVYLNHKIGGGFSLGKFKRQLMEWEEGGKQGQRPALPLYAMTRQGQGRQLPSSGRQSSQSSGRSALGLEAPSLYSQEFLEDNLISHLGVNVTNLISITPDSAATRNVSEILLKQIQARISDPEKLTVEVAYYKTEKEMEEAYQQFQKKKHRYKRNNTILGIVFEKGLSGDGVEKEVFYKIRPNSRKINTSKLLITKRHKQAFDPAKYYREHGVLGVQIILDKVLIEEMTKDALPENKIDVNNLTMSIKRFNMPKSVDEDDETPNEAFEFTKEGRVFYRWSFSICFTIMTVLSFLFLVPTVVREIVSEKETGIKELMKMSGISEWMHCLAWLLNTLCVLPITVTIIMIMFCYSLGNDKDVYGIFTLAEKGVVWVIFMLYGIWTTTYCFLVAAFFQKPSIATTYAILIWLISYGSAGVGMELQLRTLSVGAKLAFCFVPNVAIQLAISTLFVLEEKGKGGSWANITETFGADDGSYFSDYTDAGNFVPLGYIILMMAVASVVNILLALYVEAIMPKRFGVRKVPWFIFLPSEWSCLFRKKNKVRPLMPSSPAPAQPTEEKAEEKGKEAEDTAEAGKESSTGEKSEEKLPTPQQTGEQAVATGFSPILSAYESGPGFEEDPTGLNPGVQILHLRKEFGGKKVAVEDLSVNMFEGQIFCLLGENGAGKTTTTSVLTGLTAATSGTAVISGYDIHTGMEKIRKSLGLCPQHNMLFERLTVMEHLTFFGSLKGISFREANRRGKLLLGGLGLYEKRDIVSVKLSGGQKRKLQLGCALIGDSRILFLDEPSSGMDPEARRAIWDVLLDYREGRTIILTTHFMEEADVLGDRIGIMSAGKLQCCGSPSFLKNFYGVGFTLNMTLKEGADREKILKAVEKHVQGARFKESHSSSTTELSLVLPTSTTSIFPAMFKDLHGRKDELKVDEIGMGWNSLDDVFIKVEELAHPPVPEEEEMEEALQQEQKQAPNTKETAKPTPSKQEKEVTTPEAKEDDSKAKADSTETEKNEVDTEKQEKAMGVLPQEAPPKMTRKLSAFFKQLYALLIKNVLLVYRKRQSFLIQIIIPLLLTIAIVFACSGLLETPEDPESNPVKPMPLLNLSLDVYSYGNFTTPFFYSAASGNGPVKTVEIGEAYLKVLGSYGNLQLDDKISNQRNLDFDEHIIGADIFPKVKVESTTRSWRVPDTTTPPQIIGTELIAWYSSFAFHAAPLSINVLSNAILQAQFKEDGAQYKIQAAIHPLYDNTDTPNLANMLVYRNYFDHYMYKGIYFAGYVSILLPLVLALFITSFVNEPTEERINQGKQLQMMTGVTPIQYWLSYFIVDFNLTLVMIALIFFIILAFETSQVFSHHGGLWYLFILLVVYSLPAILLSYIFSTFVRSSAEGYRRIVGIHIFTGLVLGVLCVSVEYTLGYAVLLAVLNMVGRFFPGFGLTKALVFYGQATFSNVECSVIPEKYLEIVCRKDFDTSTVSDDIHGDSLTKLLRCCVHCKKRFSLLYARIEEQKSKDARQGYDRPCFEYAPMFQWNSEQIVLHNMVSPNKKAEMITVPGMTQDIVWLFFLGIIYFIFLMLIEYGIIGKPRSKLKRGTLPPLTVMDEDVTAESDRVMALVQEGMVYEDAIVVSNLSKIFDDFWAVSSLSFGVHFGECFGLLGVNGAGKTTSFRMLTGDETVTFGEAFMGSLALKKGRKQFMSKIGYCPQFDGINEVLTGKEMLCFYARLRGLWGKQVNMEADKLLRKTGLTKSGNVQCGKYSGGMKRRLSTAIALIADPPVVLLDEPTSGVDPVSRRQFWKIISSVKNSGKAVILTSHSMEECEAICNRLGIMVNGEMQCFGGVQHLKSKFAQGYSMTVKLNPEIFAPKAEVMFKAAPPNTLPPVAGAPNAPDGTQNGPAGTNESKAENNQVMTQQQPQPSLPNPGVTEQHSKVTQYEENAEVDEIIRSIFATFEDCDIKDRHMVNLKFRIYNVEGKPPLTWDELYTRMEKTKEKWKPKIEEYAIFETSLEEVFLAFARTQYTQERPQALEGCCCCCCCCCGGGLR